MAIDLPRISLLVFLQVLYALVWATVTIVDAIQGAPVTAEWLGLLVAGVIAIQVAFRDKTKPPEEP